MPAPTVAAVTATQKKTCCKDIETIFKIIVFAGNE